MLQCPKLKPQQRVSSSRPSIRLPLRRRTTTKLERNPRPPRCDSGSRAADTEETSQDTQLPPAEQSTADKSPPQKQRVLVLTETSSLMRPIPYPTWFGAPSNIIFASLVLLAIRFGRWSADEHRLRRFGLQRGLDLVSGENRELAIRRKEFEKKRMAAAENETRQRMEEAERKAKQEAALRKEKELKYKEEQEREIRRLQALKLREKQKFEEQENLMESELEKRMEVERRIQAELEAKKKAEAEERRRIEEERRREEAERKRALEAERERQLEELRLKKLQEKEALNRQKIKFAIRFEGQIELKRAFTGTTTSGPLSMQALCTISFSIKTSLSEKSTSMDGHFASVEDVEDSVGELIGFVCRETVNDYISNARLQHMSGSGPLSVMGEIDLDLFTRYASVSLHHHCESKLLSLLKYFQQSSVQQNQKAEINVKLCPLPLSTSPVLQERIEWGVLPKGHEQRLDVVVDSLLEKLPKEGAATDNNMEELVQSEIDDMKDGFDRALEAVLYAYVFDRALGLKDDSIYETSVSLIRRLLEKSCKKEPEDSLLPQAKALNAALGEDHPVSSWFAELADKNLSVKTRKRLKEAKDRVDAALKDQILRQEWPDKRQTTAEKLKDMEESNPVPEQVWALRNVAKTLAMTGNPSEAALNQSVDLMKKALRLTQKHLGSQTHPGMIGPLRDYAQILRRIDTEAAGMIWEQILEIMVVVSDRYRREGSLFSAALIAETGLLQGEAFLDLKNPEMKKLQKTRDALITGLDERESTRLAEIRKAKNGMDAIVDAFTTKLGAYKSPDKLDRIEQWSQDQPLDPL